MRRAADANNGAGQLTELEPLKGNCGKLQIGAPADLIVVDRSLLQENHNGPKNAACGQPEGPLT